MNVTNNLNSVQFNSVNSVSKQNFKSSEDKIDENNNDKMWDLSRIFPKNIENYVEKTAKELNLRGIEKMLLAAQLQMLMSDYHVRKDIHPTTMLGNDYRTGEPIHTDHLISKSQMKTLNFEDFLNKALKSFTIGLHSTSGEVQDVYQNLVNNFTSLQKSFYEVKSEDVYA